MSLPELNVIAENATKNAYSIDKIAWHKGVNTGLYFSRNHSQRFITVHRTGAF